MGEGSTFSQNKVLLVLILPKLPHPFLQEMT